MFKKLIIFLLLVVVVTGCSVSINSSKPVASSTQSSTDVKPPARESLFPSYVHQHIPKTLVLSDDQLVKFGKQICSDLDDAGVESRMGISAYLEGYTKGVKGVLTSSEAARFMGISIAAFCPSYEDLMS